MSDPKEPTAATSAANHRLLDDLPFDDTADFDAAGQGLIAHEDEVVVSAPDGSPVWTTTSWDFIDGENPDSVNPSLWRQTRLNAVHGLFEVVPDHVYQVRGYDLSVMSVIRSETGYIVVDPLISAETAAAAMALVREHLGDRPVVAVLHTHSHVDHYGGVRGVVDEDDVAAGRVRIVAPHGFLEHAVSENVMAGTAMGRRASYMYGNLLPKDARGAVGGGLGQTTSSGTIGLVAPTDTIERTGQTLTIDGVEIVFQDTPGAEAPAEFCFYLPRFKALCMAEIATHTLHNCYTLRGAEVRNALLWSKHIKTSLELFGEAEVVFASHHWPTWGNAAIRAYLTGQRDLYRYIHDETLRLANHGYAMDEIAETVALPDSLARSFANRGYYGSVSHDVKAQYQLYLGWFDGNPANLEPHPPVETARRRVRYMGGAEAVLARAREDFAAGDYRWVAQVVNDVVFADPDNEEARELQADTLEQLGYRAESGPWRNFYLSAAQELRQGVRELPTPSTASPDTMRALTLDMYFDYLAIRLNGPRAAGRTIRLTARFSDLDATYGLLVDNGVLNYFEGAPDPDATASVTLTRAALDDLTLGIATFEERVESGAITVDGEAADVAEFLGLLDTFAFWFPIVTPRPDPPTP